MKQGEVAPKGLPCATCPRGEVHYLCRTPADEICARLPCGDPWGVTAKRAKLLKAIEYTEAAILSVGLQASGLQALDTLLDAMKELESLLHSNEALESVAKIA